MTTFLVGDSATVRASVLDDIILVLHQGKPPDGTDDQLQQHVVPRVALTDVSRVEGVDSLGDRGTAMAAGACLVGADAGLRRTRRASAITRPELGLTLPGVLSALDVELALQLLRAMCDPAATGSREGCT